MKITEFERVFDSCLAAESVEYFDEPKKSRLDPFTIPPSKYMKLLSDTQRNRVTEKILNGEETVLFFIDIDKGRASLVEKISGKAAPGVRVRSAEFSTSALKPDNVEKITGEVGPGVRIRSAEFSTPVLNPVIQSTPQPEPKEQPISQPIFQSRMFPMGVAVVLILMGLALFFQYPTASPGDHKTSTEITLADLNDFRKKMSEEVRDEIQKSLKQLPTQNDLHSINRKIDGFNQELIANQVKFIENMNVQNKQSNDLKIEIANASLTALNRVSGDLTNIKKDIDDQKREISSLNFRLSLPRNSEGMTLTSFLYQQTELQLKNWPDQKRMDDLLDRYFENRVLNSESNVQFLEKNPPNGNIERENARKQRESWRIFRLAKLNQDF